MKSSEKKFIDLNTEEGCVELFNTSALDFYHGAYTFVNDFDYTNTLKANMLSLLIDVERVIKGCFETNLSLKGINIPLFKKMFPNFSNEIFHIENDDDLIVIGNILNSFRNINAHAIPAFNDYFVFENDFSSLRKQKRMHPCIVYLNENDDLTVAGMLFIMLNLVREQSIKNHTNKDRRIGYITCGKLCEDRESRFVSEISKVNLELQIRDDRSDDVVHAIFGSYLNKMNIEGNTYELVVDAGDNTVINLSSRINDDKIEVAQYSLTKVFYKEDFVLEIKDKKHFIELADQFPPFTFVDLLYKLDVHEFDERMYHRLISDPKWDRYQKLKYAKFYTDKNVDIITTDDSISDVRVNSNVCNSTVLTIFMKLEKLIIKYKNIDIHDMEYSRVGSLLKMIHAPDKLVSEVKLLRNYVFHGAIHGEYIYTNDGLHQYTLEFAIKVLYDLAKYFKKIDEHIFEYFCKDVSIVFIQAMLAIKTKLFIEETLKYVDDYPLCNNHNELIKKHYFYLNSGYNPAIFAQLNKLVFGKPRYMLVKTNFIDTYLVFSCNSAGREVFNNFVEDNGFTITENSNDGVVLYKTLSK